MEIKLEHVTKYYQDGDKSTKGIEDISLDLKTDGSFVVITGESGAGKSTLIRILTGLVDFDEGDITFDGIPLSGMSDLERHELYSKNISFVFQDYNLVESFSSKENIKLALVRSGMKNREADRKAMEALKRVGLEKQANIRTSKLSGGERQRVAIARSLALETKVIIFDEPTGNLDQDTSKEIISLIESIREDRLIVYVTHEYNQVKNHVTRHIVLKDGSVLSDTIIASPAGDETEKGQVEEKSRRFSLMGRLYSGFLFAFRRPGRFICTFIVLLLTSFLCLGISTLAAISYGGLTFISNQVEKGSGVGNELLVSKTDKEASPFTAPEDTFEDIYGILPDSRFYLRTASKVDQITFNDFSSDTYNSYQQRDLSFLPRTGLVPFIPSSFSAYSKNREYENGAYFVLPKGESQYYESDITENIGLTCKIMPLSLEFGFSNSMTESSFVSIKTAFFDKAPEVKIAGIYYSEDDTSKSFLYTKNDELFQSIYDYASSIFLHPEYLNGNSNIKSTLSVKSPSFEVTLEENGITHSFYEWKRYVTEGISYSATEDLFVKYKMDENSLYLDSHWKDMKDKVGIRLSGYTYTLEDFPSVKFVDTGNAYGSYDYYVQGDYVYSLFLKELGLKRRFYFKDPEKRAKFKSSLNGREYNVDVVPYCHYARAKMRTFDEIEVTERISILFIFIFLLFIAYMIMKLVRRILSNFYYRKDNDQFVLNYIGYTQSNLLFINLMQFVSVSVVSNVIALCVFLSASLVREYFSYLPGLFILAVVIDLLFSVYLSLPTRKRGKKHD